MTAKKGLIPWLSAFIAFDMVILGALLLPTLKPVAGDPALITNTIGTVITPPLLLLLASILSPDLKAALVFWRPWHALPGHRAFSKYVHGDTRIDVAALEARVGEFPTLPRDQNKEWYRIYRKHKDDFAVLDANRRFLLFRDLATVSLLLAALLPLALRYIGLEAAIWPVAAVFSAQYLLGCLAAQQAGIRYVRTVLAIESTT